MSVAAGKLGDVQEYLLSSALAQENDRMAPTTKEAQRAELRPWVDVIIADFEGDAA